MILSIDIGGANTKITEMDDNYYKIHHIYFPMWKKSNELKELLKKYHSERVEKIGVVMTAELSDAYLDKKEGVNDILDSVENAFPDKKIYLFDVNGNFITVDEGRKNYLNVAASNWTVSCSFVSKFIDKNCIFVDMGSTTTDIIPIKDGKIMGEKTDLDRLMNNQLLYIGALRTPLSFLSNVIKFRGKNTNISSEYFSITGDINLILDKINESDYTCDTPDGNLSDKYHSLVRLSKVLCADLNLVSENELLNVAEQFYNKILENIEKNIISISKRYNLNNVIIAGLGENILKDALKNYNIYSISENYGKEVSISMPSYALGRLMMEELYCNNKH